MAPVVFLLSALFPNQTKKTKTNSFGQNYNATSVWKANSVCEYYGYEMVALKQKANTEWKKTNQLLQFCSLSIVYFGEEEKGVNPEGKECSLKVTYFFSWRVFLVTVA